MITPPLMPPAPSTPAAMAHPIFEPPCVDAPNGADPAAEAEGTAEPPGVVDADAAGVDEPDTCGGVLALLWLVEPPDEWSPGAGVEPPVWFEAVPGVRLACEVFGIDCQSECVPTTSSCWLV